MSNEPLRALRAKPVVVHAIKWNGENFHQIWEFTNGLARMEKTNGHEHLVIETREGSVRISSVGDDVIRGVRGEFYPVKRDSVEGKYEEIGDENGE